MAINLFILILLKELYTYLLVSMQVSKYLARHQILLESYDVRVRLVLQPSVMEEPFSVSVSHSCQPGMVVSSLSPP